MSRAATPLLIHLHLPRNAGTTLGRTLRLKLGLWPPTRLTRHTTTLGCYHLGGYERRLDAIERMRPSKRRQVRLFEAHAGFGLHERLPEPSTYLSMLRDPIDRAVSVYYHMRQEAHLPSSMSLEAFIEEGPIDRVWWIDNAQVRYVAGTSGTIVDTPRGECPPSLLETARERLDTAFAFVGLTERYDESMVLLRRLFGWRRPCYYVAANAARGREAVDDLAPSIRERLAEMNQLDLALLEHARSLVQKRIDAFGPAFDEELARFRRGNRRHGRLVGPFQHALPRIRRRLVGGR